MYIDPNTWEKTNKEIVPKDKSVVYIADFIYLFILKDICTFAFARHDPQKHKKWTKCSYTCFY